jgi:preprotein translocase subunit SecY
MKRSAWRYLWSAHDIRRKLLLTLLILAIYRLASHVPVPGANKDVMAQILSAGGATGNLINILDLLSGGTVSRFSVLAMGVYPYITAQIILQLLTPIIPALQRRMEEDPREGQKWQEKWTYYLAVPMAALQAIGQVNIFNSSATRIGLSPVIQNFGFHYFLPSLTIIVSMTAGTMFGIWLGELISEYGLRNQGLSLIIFAGIVARIPATIQGIVADATTRWIGLIFMMILSLITIFAIVVVQQGRRNVPVMYPGRRMGARMSMPVKGTLPLMVNMAGMIPIIFAQSLLTFPSIIASFFTTAKNATIANFAQSIWRYRECILDHVFPDGGIFLLLLYRRPVCSTELWRKLEKSWCADPGCIAWGSNPEVSDACIAPYHPAWGSILGHRRCPTLVGGIGDTFREEHRSTTHLFFRFVDCCRCSQRCILQYRCGPQAARI